MRAIAVILLLSISYISKSQVNESFIDIRDGIRYHTVKIGTQTWIAENLRYNPESGSWVYDNNIANESIYGRLYNWETAQRVCPEGWHLPTDEEWTKLTDYLGGNSVSGGKLKETGLSHWKAPNTDANNESGFTARPGGYFTSKGTFGGIGIYGYWWSATESQTDKAWHRDIDYSYNNVGRGPFSKQYGFAVRCLKD